MVMLQLDADADTTIRADTDDQIDIDGGADDLDLQQIHLQRYLVVVLQILDGGNLIIKSALTSTAAELNILDGS